MKLAAAFVVALSIFTPALAHESAGRPTFDVTGTVIAASPSRLVYGIPLSVLTLETPNGVVNVSCYYRLARRCRTRPIGSTVRITGELGGSAAGIELFAYTLAIQMDPAE